MKTYSFEKLDCWQQARKLAVWIYRTTKKFPADERFGMISQMRRAAVSVASNIAEGTSRKTPKDQSHFSVIAYSSTIELLNDLILSVDLEFIAEKEYMTGRDLIEKQTPLIAGLRNAQQRKAASDTPKRRYCKIPTPQPLNPKPLNPKPLNPKPLNP